MKKKNKKLTKGPVQAELDFDKAKPKPADIIDFTKALHEFKIHNEIKRVKQLLKITDEDSKEM